MWTIKRAVSLLVAIAVIAGAGVFAWITLLRPVDVRIARSEQDVPVQVFGVGTVEARASSQVGFKVSGVSADLRADVGDRVAQGAVLAARLLAPVDPWLGARTTLGSADTVMTAIKHSRTGQPN